MTVALVSPPSVEPLTLSEVKAHLRITHDHEDDVLLDILKAARAYAEFACGQKMITQTWRQFYDSVPAGRIVALDIKPVQSIVALTGYDHQGTAHVFSVGDARLKQEGGNMFVVLSVALDRQKLSNGLEIDIVAGLADTGVEVPDLLKRAILLLIAHWYEFRGAVAPQDQPVSLPAGFDALIGPYRRVHL